MQKLRTTMDTTTQNAIDAWLNGAYDEATKKEIRRLQREAPEELIDAFYTHLSFGTGGLRGIMGVGTNRMNIYTVRAATQGLANYLLQHPLPSGRHKVLIGFDCRHHSREFAEETAKVLAANDIEVFLYKELRPVALISFGVQFKHCSAGVLITASHNPPAYNGYKVYWSHGGQVLPPHDKGIINEVNKIRGPEQVKTTKLSSPLIQEIAEEIDHAYLQTIHAEQLHPGDNQTHGKDLHVVYTSLHGGGITMIPPALKDWGFTQLTLVNEQSTPDGSFPTVKSPNPEDPAALKMGIDKLQQVNGDLLIGTDPDVDRLAVVVMHQGKPIHLNGNQTACLCLEYVCKALHAEQLWPPKPMFVKTIVTTELFRAIAEHYKATCLDVLTGFKYIGQKIAQWEEEKKADVATHHFIFGGEESYGYLLGTHARDKDAVISAALVCEVALHQKLQNKTLIDLLNEIYKKYGVFREKLESMTFEGKEGADQIHTIMERLRTSPPKTLEGTAIVKMEDYKTRVTTHLETGEHEPILLPKSDVILFWLEDGTKLVIRPSGTEPKMKIYCGCKEKHRFTDQQDLEKSIWDCDMRVDIYLKAIQQLLVIPTLNVDPKRSL